MHRVLLTGGAGYIGAVTAKILQEQGSEVLVYDHLATHSSAKLSDIPYIKGDLLNTQLLTTTLSQFMPDIVMHFAAYIQMGESVRDPRKYYNNNFLGSLNLVESMRQVGCDKLVFASTAGVYGNVSAELATRIPESASGYPTNPYGETKLATERLLKWYDQAYNFRSISIRFFNAAGAYNDLGEDHLEETHIIPNIIRAQLEGREFVLFGNDYDTPDGTCIRDYVHVLDLAEAFRLAGKSLFAGGVTTVYNAGAGTGYSNLEIIKMIEQITGQSVKIKFAPRRPGDANVLIADNSRLKTDLGWLPQHSSLETIITTAYAWHQKQ